VEAFASISYYLSPSLLSSISLVRPNELGLSSVSPFEVQVIQHPCTEFGIVRFIFHRTILVSNKENKIYNILLGVAFVLSNIPEVVLLRAIMKMVKFVLEAVEVVRFHRSFIRDLV
jgi:hypothetical protein